jgi:hypothetical protein
MKPELFTRDLLQSLPADSDDAIVVLCAEFEKFDGSLAPQEEVLSHNDYLEAFTILKAFCESRSLVFSAPALSTNQRKNIDAIKGLFAGAAGTATTNIIRRDSNTVFQEKGALYADIFARISVYEFSDGDFARVQQLINELRDLISNSNLITGDHKRRLLRRLEAMQAELHKRSSDIDRFWGFIGEAGIAVRKFGEDIKPISERIQELGRIVIAVIFAKEGIQALPEITQLLTLKK